jgi:hypothetical protein
LAWPPLPRAGAALALLDALGGGGFEVYTGLVDAAAPGACLVTLRGLECRGDEGVLADMLAHAARWRELGRPAITRYEFRFHFDGGTPEVPMGGWLVPRQYSRNVVTVLSPKPNTRPR